MNFVKKFKWVAIFIIFVALVLFYKTYNPYEYSFYPKCPFYTLTGYKCPGCGSQRAVHFLLNFEIADALKENWLFVIMMPYLFFAAVLDLLKQKNEKAQLLIDKFYGLTAIRILTVIVILFWIGRNL